MAQPQPQPQAQRPKTSLDTLQGMLNGILIETGRALKASNSGGSRSLAATATRLPTTIHTAHETFHQALDEIECNIFRAKSVLLRDLEGLRAKRQALENPPPPVIEEEPTNGAILEEEKAPEVPFETEMLQADTQLELDHSFKQESSRSPEKTPNAQATVPDPPKETIVKPEPTKPLQAPSPLAFLNETTKEAKPIGLGINTNAEPSTSTSAPATADAQDSAIDSLFDMPDDANGDMDFDNMDFSYNSNTNQDTSQTQNNEFDLSTFGNDTQDFTMSNMTATNDTTTANNTANTSQNKPVEDIFSGLDTTGTGDNMELDNLFGTLGAEESVFDDMLFGAGDGGGEMVHGEYDNAFFGLED